MRLGTRICVLALLLFALAPAAAQAAKLRTYYVAADEVVWNYTPTGRNQITGKPFEGMERMFTERGGDRIGTTYRKSRYREYTDGSFRLLKQRPAKWRHLGILGPLVRADVGDRVKIVVKNNTSFPMNLHVHGLFYLKRSEGSPYSDGTSGAGKRDDMIKPGPDAGRTSTACPSGRGRARATRARSPGCITRTRWRRWTRTPA